MNQSDRDSFITMRKIINRKHSQTVVKIKRLSAKLIETPSTEVREELLRCEGEKRGTCFALKVLDRECQTEAVF